MEGRVLPKLVEPDATGIGGAVVRAAVAAVVLVWLAAVVGDLHLWGDGVWHLVALATTVTRRPWPGNALVRPDASGVRLAGVRFR